MLLLLAMQSLLVAAASDLAPVEPLLRERLQATGLAVRFVLGSSGQLANQIRHGAPYDVYLSANESFVTELTAEKKLISPLRYATGRLALYSRAAGIDQVDKLIQPAVRHVALANPAHAPYGVAALEILAAYGLRDRLQGKIVFAENVRQAVQFVESGNAEAGLVAWSLVKGKPGAVLIPAKWHNPVVQAGGVVAATSQRDAAHRFLAFLVSPEGRKLLQSVGFDPPAR
jgi:molybdate transport system substrate-binding protein